MEGVGFTLRRQRLGGGRVNGGRLYFQVFAHLSVRYINDSPLRHAARCLIGPCLQHYRSRNEYNVTLV